MKQTAVEWLFEQLCSEKLSWKKDSNGKLFIDGVTSNIFQQAKEMEKQQIIDSNKHGFTEGTCFGATTIYKFETAEEYYNETYKKR